MLRRFCALAFVVATVAAPGVADAAVLFSGTGTGTGGSPLSATAEFDFVSHNFGSGNVAAVQITLSNTAASTTARGNLVTGLFFSLSGGVGALPTGATGFDALAAVVALANGSTASNVDLAPAVNNGSTDGGYQLSNGPFGTANSGASYASWGYGIGTVGMGLSGFSGTAVNGDDYGIFATGSTVTSGGLAAARPLVDGSVVFWIAKPTLWTDLSQLGNSVQITFGSLPDNAIIATSNQSSNETEVPEPATVLGLAAGLLGLCAARRRRASA